MNHLIHINHKTNRYGMCHPIFFCFPLVCKKHQLYVLSRSNAHIHMIGRKKKKKETLTIHLSSFLHLSFISYTCYMLSPAMRVTEKGGAMAKTNERMRARVIKDNLPLLSLSLLCVCSLSSFFMCGVHTSTQIRTM